MTPEDVAHLVPVISLALGVVLGFGLGWLLCLERVEQVERKAEELRRAIRRHAISRGYRPADNNNNNTRGEDLEENYNDDTYWAISSPIEQ